MQEIANVYYLLVPQVNSHYLIMLYLIFGIFSFIYLFCKFTCGWCNSKVCLVDRTALITGGNSGIGYQAALSLASRGCRVIIADKDDASCARENIIKETGNHNIITKKLDLQSFDSVRKFAKEIIETEVKLHILINNAGIGTVGMKHTEDGIQKTMQVNYYSHFLMTHLLLDLLKKSAPSRIIFTSSIAAFLTKLKLEDMNPSETNKTLPRIYANSKLCEVIAANGFAEKLKGTGVTCNSFHPGGVRSQIYLKAIKEEIFLLTILSGILTLPFGKSTEEGAQTMIYLACAKEVENITGQFFMDCRQFLQPFQTYNKEFCKKVWNMSMKCTSLETK